MSNSLDIVLNPKQALAMRYLLDKSTKDLLYGGGGGSGKSWLAAVWLWILMNNYKNLRFAVCRKQLNDVAGTFTGTFFKVVNYYGDRPSNYKKSQSYIVNLKTGSEIIFKSLIYLPTDPEFDRLGSCELTGAIIEEAQEITREAYQVLKSRVGRQLNKEYNITPKVLLLCNPAKNFLYTDFYKLKDDPIFNLDKKVVLATHKDNLEYLPEAYIETLSEISDPIVRARIMEGSWDFSDLNVSTVLPMSLIVSCIGVEAEDGDTRIGIDVGGPQSYSDKTIVQVIHGNYIEEPIVIDSKSFDQAPYLYDEWLSTQLIEIIEGENITNYKNVRLDACGIGAAIYENIRKKGYSVFPFRGMDRPFKRQYQTNNYLNLRTQSLYELKEKFRLRQLALPARYNETLVEDLSAVRYTETGGKIGLEDKKFTRKRLGRSPDFGDALAMAALEIGNTKAKNAKDTDIASSIPITNNDVIMNTTNNIAL